MTLKERVIKRLNKGFGLSLTMETTWLTRLRNGCAHGCSWKIGKFCCDEPASEAIKWDRWVIADGEIIEYFPNMHDTYISREYLIENK